MIPQPSGYAALPQPLIHNFWLYLAVQRSALANELLPSFARLGTTVDLRPGFVEGSVAITVPVALVHLTTDVREHRLWFQITKPQLEHVIRDLKDTVHGMQMVEQWADKASGSKD